jgi:chaperonin cofactor prefoldin
MEQLQQRLEQLKQQEASLLMQLDEVKVLINAYENTLKPLEAIDEAL